MNDLQKLAMAVVKAFEITEDAPPYNGYHKNAVRLKDDMDEVNATLRSVILLAMKHTEDDR